MNCAFCTRTATLLNSLDQPTCSRHNKMKQAIKTPSCPMCKSIMALRKGKFGSFWGCMAYPNCMGTIKL